MLYLVATPIGNLEDITLRALKILKECDYILCEDTRHSRILLNHYDISKPLKSYHKFNESSSEEAIIEDLKRGLKICLISDAGTPAISDPGEDLVKACIEQDIPVSAIPGPCAAIVALTCSGLSGRFFQFKGFLSKKDQALQGELIEILKYPGTTICYESPHRIQHLLEKLATLAPTRKLVLARELTKKFEEFDRDTSQHLWLRWKNKDPKGEFILLIEQCDPAQNEWEHLTILAHIEKVQNEFNLTKKEAIKLVAELRSIPKKEVYKETI